jgi:membrane protein YfhO
VYENRFVLPRAYVAFNPQIVRSGEEAWQAITDPGFNRTRTVVIEEYDAAPSPEAIAPDPFMAIRSARIVSYDPTRVTIEVDSPRSGYVVLTDTAYPGWKAAVDEHPVPIYQANYLFRAVPVSPGTHTVVFRYEPLNVRIGAALSVIALCLMVLSVAPTRILPRSWRRA